MTRREIVVAGIGITLSLVVLARVYSLLIDGMSLFYLGVETLLALVFLSLPPPADH